MSSARCLILAALSASFVAGVAEPAAVAPAPSFTVPKEYATGNGPDGLVSGDLNGDGSPDLVTANHTTVSVLVNRGDGSFHAKRDYRAGGTPLAIGDLNGDRKLDLVTTNSVIRGTVSVLLNKGNGRFGAKRDYRAGRGPESIAMGDLNGDRKLDLATANIYSENVSVLLNRGDGSFRAPREYRSGDDPGPIAIADLNGDGKLDLVTGNASNTVSVLLNRGGGRSWRKRDYRTGPDPVALAIGDLNADRKLDLVTTNLGKRKTVSVLLNRGNGRFGAKRDYRTGGIYSVAVGDLNGDRKLDLVTGNVSGFVSVLLNKGDGTFRARLEYRVQAKLQLRSAGAEWVAIGDLNADGKRDLATSNMDTDTVSVLINTPGLCVVQDVRRMTLLVAEQTLARVNCHIGEVARDRSDAFKRGQVMRQKPAPGTVEPEGDKVDLVVSLGPQS